MKRYYVLLLLMVISVPFLLGFNAWQSNECGKIKRQIRELETMQENCVENNKTLVADLADLLGVDKLEYDVKNKLGLKKNRPEDITLIIMGGKGLDL